MNEAKFSSRILGRFAETISTELGAEQFSAVLNMAGLPAEWTDIAALSKLSATESAQAYGRLQASMRTYYGRGARGILLRVGNRMWERLLEDAALGGKAQAALIRGLPAAMRRKPALELLARFLSPYPGDVTVHNMDLDLLLIDHASPATQGYSDSAPICFITRGLIRECLYWATGKEHDIEETLCRASGGKECEFKITGGG